MVSIRDLRSGQSNNRRKKMPTKEPKITLSEIQKEIDAMRSRSPWTKEMDEAILYARSGDNPLSFRSLEVLFAKKKWDKKNSSIQVRYAYLTKNKPK